MNALICISSSDASGNNGDVSGDHGRGIYLKDSIASPVEDGTIILRTEPTAKMLDPEMWSTRCHTCFQEADIGRSLQRCGSCKTVYYCSRQCQAADWKPHHKVECKKLKDLVKLNLTAALIADVLLLGRVSRLLTSHQTNAEAGVNQNPLPADMVWFEEDCDQVLTLIAGLAVKIGLLDAREHDVSDLTRMLSRFKNNNFTICDERFYPLGAGCYPLASMANHSCDANCTVMFDEDSHTLTLRLLHTLHPGEEVTINYVDAALPRAKRQEHLQDRYHFTCNCSRCSVPMSDSAQRDAVLDASYDGIPQNEWSESEKLEVDTLLGQLQTTDDKEAIYQRLKTKLHPHNSHILQAMTTMSNQALERNDFATAELYATDILAFYDWVYAGPHPMASIYLTTLLDITLMASPSNHSKAVIIGRKALEMLQITHGEESKLYKTVLDRMEGITEGKAA